MLTWNDGQDAEVVIPLLPENEQYVFGLKAGKIVKKLHSITASDTQENWHIRFNRKTGLKKITYTKGYCIMKAIVLDMYGVIVKQT